MSAEDVPVTMAVFMVPMKEQAGLHVELDAALLLATSPNYADRCTAGVVLASQADLGGEARVALWRLVLDPHDTMATREVAAALLARDDVAATELVACALTEADDSIANWILEAANDAAQDDRQRLRLRARLVTLEAAQHPQSTVGAKHLLACIEEDAMHPSDPSPTHQLGE